MDELEILHQACYCADTDQVARNNKIPIKSVDRQSSWRDGRQISDIVVITFESGSIYTITRTN